MQHYNCDPYIKFWLVGGKVILFIYLFSQLQTIEKSGDKNTDREINSIVLNSAEGSKFMWCLGHFIKYDSNS